MQKVLVVRVEEAVRACRWNVVINHEVDFRHIYSTSKYISRDERREGAQSKAVNDRVSVCRFEPSDQDLRFDTTRFELILKLCGRVLSIYKDHSHGTVKLGVKPHDKVKFLLCSHLHFVIFHTLQLLSFLHDREVLELADKAPSLLNNCISVGG